MKLSKLGAKGSSQMLWKAQARYVTISHNTADAQHRQVVSVWGKLHLSMQLKFFHLIRFLTGCHCLQIQSSLFDSQLFLPNMPKWTNTSNLMQCFDSTEALHITTPRLQQWLAKRSPSGQKPSAHTRMLYAFCQKNPSPDTKIRKKGVAL